MLNFGLFDLMLDGILVISSDGKVAYCNEAMASILNQSIRRILKRDYKEIFPQSERWVESIASVQSGRDFSPYVEVEIALNEREAKRIQFAAQKFQEQILVYVRDNSLETVLYEKYRRELVQKEDLINQLNAKVFELEFLLNSAALSSSEEVGAFSKYAVLLKAQEGLGPEVILTFKATETDQGHVVLDPGESLRGKDISEGQMKRLMAEETRRWSTQKLQTVFDQSSHVIFDGEPASVSCGIRSKSGEWHIYSYCFFKEPSAAVRNAKLLDSLTRQTAVILENQELFHQSITDEKTSLFNQRYFNYRFEQELTRARRSGNEFVLLLFDIDHFKKFNDTYGHSVGDLVLIEVAKVIKNSFRTTDIAARFGGEEFVILCLDTKFDGVLDFINRIREAVEKNQVKIENGMNLSVTVSIGVSSFPHHGATYKELFDMADQALYEAKRKGRNRVEIAKA